MIERLSCPMSDPPVQMRSSAVRYDLLQRLSRSAERRQVRVLAFGIGERELRLVLEGSGSGITNTVRGLKTGTVNKLRGTWGATLRWSPGDREGVPDWALTRAVTWAHGAPLTAGASDPLASPWSSHRDLLGYREASFYDPSVLRGRVDPTEVHLLAGGRPLPRRWRGRGHPQESLLLLMRLSGAVLGVLPNHPAAHGLFAHLGQARGWRRPELSAALAISARWLRELLARPAPQLGVALICLADPRLCQVP